MVFGVTTAWADEITATLDHTAGAQWGSNKGASTVDAEKEHYNNDAASSWAGCAYAKFSATIPNGHSITKAILTYSVNQGGKSGRNDIIYYMAKEFDLDWANFAGQEGTDLRNASNRAGKAVEAAATGGTGDRLNLTQDVTDAVKAIFNEGQNYIIFQWTGNAGGADLYGKASTNAPSLVITTADASSVTSYTVKFTDGTNELKEPAVYTNVAIGSEQTASANDMQSFIVGGKKYIYQSGNTTITTVADAASNIITLVFREAATVSYTLTDNTTSTVLSEGTGFEADVISAYYPHYILKEGVLYECPKQGTNPWYGVNITLGATATSQSVSYTATEISNIVFVSEGEAIAGTNKNVGNYADIRSFGGAVGYSAEDIIITNLPRGKYKIKADLFTPTSAMGSQTIVVGSNEVLLTSTGNGYHNEHESEEIELTTATDVVWKGGSTATNAIDWIYIQKTGDVEEPAFDPATAIVNAGFNPEADPLGWDKVTSAQYYDLGMGLIGTYQVRGEHAAATVDETHLATEFAAGLECRWQTNYAAFTQTTTELPAGAYKLTFDVENTNATTTKANYENRFNITVGETTYADESTEWMNGKSAWTTHTIAFTLTEASPITISLGYGTGSNNFGVGNTPALFVSHLNLETISALDLALIDLKAAIDAAKAKLASYPIGDVYFTYPASEIAGLAFLIGMAEGTYNAAESVEAVKEATKNLNDYVATFKPIMQIPTEGKAYYIANKTAEGNLCIGTEEVTIAKDAAVFFTKAEGGFVLSNEEGNYILKTAANNWTLSTTANKDEAYVVNFNLVDGAYTIQGAKGLFGTDNATEGSTVYANKAQANNGLWTITAVPEFKPAYGTLWTEAEGYSETEEPEPYKYIVLDNKYFKNLAKAGDTIKVAISSVGNQAEGSRSLIITTGKLEMNIGNDGQNTDIQQGTTSYEFTLDANEIEKIQDGADVILKWKYMTVAQVELTEFKKEQLIDNGTYYIAAAEKITSDNPTYMAAGNAWGTHGIVNNAGLDLDITYNEASKDYYINTRISNGGNNHYLGSGLYMDAPAFGWKIEEVTNGFNIYGMFDGVKKYVSAATDGNLVLSENPYPWIFIHISNWNSVMKDVHESILNAATVENPADVTFLLKDANFNRNDLRWEAWTVSEDCGNKNLGGGCSETNGNGCAESYHSTFTISQIAEGAPKGIYAVTAQGFYRQDTEGDFALPYFFANDEKANFPLRTGTENSMTDAGVSFTNGLYTIDPIYVEVAENGTLTVGTKSETANFWCIWDNFKLTYYGANATMDEVKNGAIVKELADLRAKAQNMLADIEVDAVKNAINDALTATADVTGADAINAAIATMKAAIEKGEASIIAKNTLPKMKQLTEETNLYTAEALNTYYTQWEVKYLDGSLTKTEATTNLQDPFLVTSWRANAVANTLLMSAWDETPMNWNSYHLNTWSTEGSTDGSNFVVPFIEYWTGDGESLAEKTLTATMNDVQKGIYDVTAWVRVRIKNGATAPATGIFFQVNDQTGESVVGEQLGNTQFYLKEMATKATVDTDGKLTIKFNVAADNNISWLAFKNVKFAYNENATVGITNVNNAKNANDAIYNLNGQKVQKAQKGLYIINGKKTVVK